MLGTSSVWLSVDTSASKCSIQRFVITEKAPNRAFSWLKTVSIVIFEPMSQIHVYLPCLVKVPV